MSSKKKETENGSNESGRKFTRNWVTWDEFQGLSGHGHHMFISTRPPVARTTLPAPESDSEKAESEGKASDS